MNDHGFFAHESPRTGKVSDRVTKAGIPNRGVAENLAAARDEAALYRRLATLRRDVPLEQTLDDLEWRGARREELEPLLKEYGDTSLLERVPRWLD